MEIGSVPSWMMRHPPTGHQAITMSISIGSTMQQTSSKLVNNMKLEILDVGMSSLIFYRLKIKSFQLHH